MDDYIPLPTLKMIVFGENLSFELSLDFQGYMWDVYICKFVCLVHDVLIKSWWYAGDTCSIQIAPFPQQLVVYTVLQSPNMHTYAHTPGKNNVLFMLYIWYTNLLNPTFKMFSFAGSSTFITNSCSAAFSNEPNPWDSPTDLRKPGRLDCRKWWHLPPWCQWPKHLEQQRRSPALR